jgi:pyruvate carboxylase
MFSGSLGEPEGGWPERMQQVVLGGAKPKPGRPGSIWRRLISSKPLPQSRKR